MADSNNANSYKIWAPLTAMILYNPNCNIEEIKKGKEEFLRSIKSDDSHKKFLEELYDLAISILENKPNTY